ncbi:helix-turn-helix transcriptional regulator [Rhodococcus globerulus]|uniref:Helix-turn-helix transcriptional regulator n=1 Tax=Rhodococcus globerulus TaxID=33008 RepID=A0ABU4C4Q1_RHOGO|nr:helix-turn-helix transcriptional regulator [Rhodococcus globerulus]MDV6271193.1 helix-turn-helix transcriptional regulator [Rhodococcus globerulus]
MPDMKDRRIVTGELIDELISGSAVARVEFLRRRSDGVLNLSFQQQALALYWFGSGFRDARLDVDRKTVDARLSSRGSFGLVAPGTSLEGEFRTDSTCNYAVMFVNAPSLAAQVRSVDNPMLIFDDPRLHLKFQELHREIELEPDHRDLLVEGWALQSMVRLARQVRAGVQAGAAKGKLSQAALTRVDDLISQRIGETIRVEDLANAAGYSERHFARAFKAATGTTPSEYVMARRVKLACQLIRDGVRSMTAVAVTSGFATPQHFSSTFKKQVGVSPLQFSKQVDAS